jgi:aminoglycoside phosphotransferase (APT) family kinase protein
MRGGWRRGTPAIRLDLSVAELLVRHALPDACAVRVRSAAGGLSNTNLRVVLAGEPASVLLRLYQRDPLQAGKEAALVRLAAPRVPVARFLHLSQDGSPVGHPWAVLEWVDGRRLETVLPGAGPVEAASLGRAVGATLAAIHGFAFDEHGFLDAGLRVRERIAPGRDGLLDYLRRCMAEGPAAARLGAGVARELLAFAEREGHRLERWPGGPRLVHADFNGSNILVRRASDGTWEVAAVLDWEFALSGSPAMDFGNLLRRPADDVPGFADAVAIGYRSAGGVLPEDWRAAARLMDLAAWVDFLSRPGAGRALIDDARTVIAATLAGAGPSGK